MEQADENVETEHHNVFEINEEEHEMLHYIRKNNINIETLRQFIHDPQFKLTREPYVVDLEDITDTEDENDVRNHTEVTENIFSKNETQSSADQTRIFAEIIRTALIRTFLQTLHSSINCENEMNTAEQAINANDRPTVFRNVLNKKSIISANKTQRSCQKHQTGKKRRRKIQTMQCQPFTTTQPLLFNPYLPFLMNEHLSPTSNTSLESDLNLNSLVGDFAPEVSFTNVEINDNDILFEHHALIDRERISHNDETEPAYQAHNFLPSLQQIDIPAPNVRSKCWPKMAQLQSTQFINRQSSSSSSFHQMQHRLADPFDYGMSRQTVEIQHIPQTNQTKQVSEPLLDTQHQTQSPILNNLNQSSILHNQLTPEKYTDQASTHLYSGLPPSVYKLRDMSLNQQNVTRPAYQPSRPIHQTKLNSTIVSNPADRIQILNVTQLQPPNNQYQEIPLRQTQQPEKQRLSFIGPQDKLPSYQVPPIQVDRNPALLQPTSTTVNQYLSSNEEVWSKQTQLSNNLPQFMWPTNTSVLETHHSNLVPSSRGRQKSNVRKITKAQCGTGKRKYTRRQRGSSTTSGRNISQPDLLEVPAPEYARTLAYNVPSNLQSTINPLNMWPISNCNNALPSGTCSCTTSNFPEQQSHHLSSSGFTEIPPLNNTRAIPNFELPTNNQFLPNSESLRLRQSMIINNPLRSTLEDMRYVQAARPAMQISQPWMNAASTNVQQPREPAYNNGFYNNQQWNNNATMPHPHVWQPRRFDF